MSESFTKLFSSITESTVWCESSDTRIVWITMLAMCDQGGCVYASIPGLAHRARVSIEATREAMTAFLSPDPDSRTKDHEGRRVEEIDGGWRLLNHAKYRSARSIEERREYQAEWVRENRAKAKSNQMIHVDKASTLVDTHRQMSTMSTEVDPSESDTDTESDTDIQRTEGMQGESRQVAPSPAAPFVLPDVLNTPAFRAIWADWEKHRREKRQKLTPTATRQQLKRLAEMGVERATTAIFHSIANGWTGIFEPDSKSTSGSNWRGAKSHRMNPDQPAPVISEGSEKPF
jgi:hypothetical protein